MESWFAIGAALGLAGGLSPGPMTALVLTQTLQFGTREGLKVALAPVLTDGPLLLLTAWLAHGLAGADTLLGMISLGGAVFLSMLARESWHATPPSGGGEAGSLRKALMTNVLNPHPYVFWLTVGGPTVARSWEADAWMGPMAFCLGFFAFLCGSKAVLATLVGRYTEHVVGRPYRWIMRGLALVMVGFAAAFLYDGISRLTG